MQTLDGKKIGIIGAGALGGFYGAKLARAGFDVHFLMRRDADAVRRNGLVVHSIDGDFTVHPPVYASPDAMGPCDFIIVGLKAFDNAALPALLAHVAEPQTRVLTLQNGLGNEEAIAAALASLHGGDAAAAARRVMGGTAFLCSNRGEPGVIHHTGHGAVRIAEFVAQEARAGAASNAPRVAAEAFARADIDAAAADSLMQIRWEKLVWNIPFNGLGVAPGADAAAVLADAALLATARGLMSEVIAAARADGVTIDAAFAEKNIEATRVMGPYKSSMQIDAEAGRPLEVEAILGEPLRRAQAAGIATPLLAELYVAVKRRP